MTTTTTATACQFPGHVAGEPYSLTREQFAKFAGLDADYKAVLGAIKQRAAGGRLPGNGHRFEPEQQALWAAIASFEAMRRFQEDMCSCDSSLYMEVGPNSAGPTQMKWRYSSYSGTVFTVIESRKYNDASEDEQATLPEPMFLVVIPATRDQPGRTHYEAIRRGGSYRDF
jgi:hypothetical protein